MRQKLSAIVHKFGFAGAVLSGVMIRLGLAFAGVGMWNAGHDHLNALKHATGLTPEAATPDSISAFEASTAFGDGLLRPLVAGVVGGLQKLGLAAPEDLVLGVGLLAVLLRLGLGLGLWRVTRGYWGDRRLGHPAWLLVGCMQGALATVVLGGLLALGPTPEAQLMVHLRDDPQARAVVALGARLEPFFLGGRKLKLAEHPRLDETWLRQTLLQMAQDQAAPNRFVFFASDRDASEVMLILEGQSCPEPQVFSGSWLDRLAVKLDATRYVRRGPLLLYRCSSSDVAEAFRPSPWPRRVAQMTPLPI